MDANAVPAADDGAAEPGEASQRAPDPPEADDGHDWAGYYRHTLGRDPRPLFMRGLDAVAAAGGAPGTAVEIGFGDGTETLRLLEAGWRVMAIDSAPAAAGVLEPRVPPSARDRLTIVTEAAGEVALPPFDLLYSAYVLSYLDPAAFARLWSRARAALRPGGLVVVNIFGDRHGWAAEPGTTFLARGAVERLLDGLEVLVLEEVEEDGNSFVGPTHWHYFDILARRPA